jgi:hypothetical protein
MQVSGRENGRRQITHNSKTRSTSQVPPECAVGIEVKHEKVWWKIVTSSVRKQRVQVARKIKTGGQVTDFISYKVLQGQANNLA